MKIVILTVIALLSTGCASKSYMQSPEWQAMYQQSLVANQQNQLRDFQRSTIEAERNTVARVNALEERVCELERERGHRSSHTDRDQLDRQFKKYMSK